MRKVKSEKAPAETTRKPSKAPVVATGGLVRKGRKGSAAVGAKGAGTSAAAAVRRGRIEAKGAGKPGRKSVAKGRRGTAGRKQAPKPQSKPLPPLLQIRRLDPVRVCGDRTSVVQLFRVDEEAVAVGKAAGARQVHLVFNDRHGWYCEHGRSCHAVSAVMRHAGIR